jgi:hypothetical protein
MVFLATTLAVFASGRCKITAIKVEPRGLARDPRFRSAIPVAAWPSLPVGLGTDLSLCFHTQRFDRGLSTSLAIHVRALPSEMSLPRITG